MEVENGQEIADFCMVPVLRFPNAYTQSLRAYSNREAKWLICNTSLISSTQTQYGSAP